MRLLDLVLESMVIVDGETLESVSTFCCLGDIIGNTGDCMDAITARIKSAWKKFREILLVFAASFFTLVLHGL